MLEGLLDILKELKNYNQVLDCLSRGEFPVMLTNLIQSQKVHLAVGIAKSLSKKNIFITYSEINAKQMCEDLSFFLPNKVKFYPSKDIIFYNADVRSNYIIKQRFDIIQDLIAGEDITIVLSIDALFDRLTDKNVFKKHILKIKLKDNFDIDNLIEKFVFMGYERRDAVDGIGQFSVRGGIIDIFAPNLENAIRIELWADEVDSIRILDTNSQRSIDKINEITIFPTRELVYDKDTLNNAIQNIESEYHEVYKEYKSKSLFAQAENLEESFCTLIEKMKNLNSFSGIDKYFQYFYEEKTSILDYIDDDTLIFVDEPSKIYEHAKNILYEFEESIKNRILKGLMLPSCVKLIYPFEQIIQKIESKQSIILSNIQNVSKDIKIKKKLDFNVKSVPIVKERIDLLINDIKLYLKNNYRVLILAGATLRCERIFKELSENGISCNNLKKTENYEFKPNIVAISRGNLNKGFVYEDIKFVVITDKELFSKDLKKQKPKRKNKSISAINAFTDLKIGDYIVHQNHGIGVYKGIEKIVTDNNISRDYIKVSYADGGNLYVHTNQMDLIQKYVGAENIKLNKLGGTDWAKIKSRAKGAVAILAKDLLDLYAKRHMQKGFIYSEDTLWQNEFEEQFPYEETEDQLEAIKDVKNDMQSQKVMDRLICGDVGYGKTEVAIRAAFKAITDGKQVVYLVPTTILAQQHYNTFVNRMHNFSMNVEILCRFRTQKQQKASIKGLEEGIVDIVIGTHRVLSKDIKFKNLGLIIIDEEQRFGVSQKEKLKRIKENIDVLSLSATPIPRTLHMSLIGIRDISLLEEAPQERQQVQTYVMEHDDSFIKDAINREISRQGQVYYLYNRVKNIEDITKNLQNLVPNATIRCAHGQMSERELENIMIEFIDAKIDVLVCTTIIETGLDIPNANTIIIHDADCMGLSQLYQLRGRVGRSKRSSFAYLLYKKDKSLTEVAEKRLQILKDFTEFCSGFKIAMRDLEIRGAGNLLGSEQHGHIDSIGYDMYCKMLDEEVRRLKGEIIEEDFETSIDIIINAYIPHEFIKNEEQKLEIYKKISYIKNKQDYFDIYEEIEDRFGNLPTSVQNLLKCAYIKALAHNIFAISLICKNNKVMIVFKKDAKIKFEKIKQLILSKSTKFLFVTEDNPTLTYIISDKENINILNTLKLLIESLQICIE